VLVASTFWNLRSFSSSVSRLPARESEPVVEWEDKFLRIHFALIRENYHKGKIEYATARSFRGEPKTENDDTRSYHLRYVTIPLILAPDSPDAPYVIGDFTGGDPVPDTPEGLKMILDPGNGLILYKRLISP
jgi:hypothetical protein